MIKRNVWRAYDTLTSRHYRRRQPAGPNQGLNVDIIGNAIATWLVVIGGRLGTRGKGWIFGSNVERCLQRVAESAVKKVVNDAAPYLDETMRGHIADLLRRSLAQPELVQRLIGPVMIGDVEASVGWRHYVEERLTMINWPTVPDLRLAEVITGLPAALHAGLVEEGSRPASPLFPMLVMLGLQELRLGMRALHKQANSRAVADSASAAGYAVAGQATYGPGPETVGRDAVAVDRRPNNVVVSPHAYREPITGVEFVGVPGGVFEMGSSELTRVERPSHWASVSSFWMARTPVTNEQYRAYVTQTGEAFPLSFARREFAGPQQPVVGVSWDEARWFCGWLSTESGKPINLPTEAQWEYAARGPESMPYPWGEAAPTPSVTHYGQPIEEGHTLEVGAHRGAVGPFGHLQLLGNVWEWCLDEWSPEAYLARTETVPLNPRVHGDGAQRAVRGAGWQCTQNRVHSAHRCHNHRSFRGWATGFRVMIGERHDIAI